MVGAEMADKPNLRLENSAAIRTGNGSRCRGGVHQIVWHAGYMTSPMKLGFYKNSRDAWEPGTSENLCLISFPASLCQQFPWSGGVEVI